MIYLDPYAMPLLLFLLPIQKVNEDSMQLCSNLKVFFSFVIGIGLYFIFLISNNHVLTQ